MSKLELKVNDPIVAKVLTKMAKRSEVGQVKYGKTIDEEIKTNVKNITDYVIDVQEELMDAVLYLEAVKDTLPKPIKFIEDEYDEFADWGSSRSGPPNTAEEMMRISDLRQTEVKEHEERMRNIGQNGNDGLHYDKPYRMPNRPVNCECNCEGEGPAMFRDYNTNCTCNGNIGHNID